MRFHILLSDFVNLKLRSSSPYTKLTLGLLKCHDIAIMDKISLKIFKPLAKTLHVMLRYDIG